ncbi:type IV pilus modification PilV family protein [Luteolibacter algae]|uniref:type IV pilus modification PilV family protein n=1 Tax=Luteolibacter algae TaxID=454151 RepID=UPI0036DF98DE
MRKYLSIRAQGMTLMEVVIAIAVVAFVVPIIIAATGVTSRSRSQAEADTRSAWIVRKIQQEISAKWAEPMHKSFISADFKFPEGAGETSSAILLFDKEGKFLEEGNDQAFEKSLENTEAVYVVKVSAERYGQVENRRVHPKGGFSLMRIEVAHPAKSAVSARDVYRYQYVRSRGGAF